MKKIGFVIPWYSERIPGGAEMELRGLTTHLHESGVELEILTTCVKEFSADWNVNFFREGVEKVSSVQELWDIIKEDNDAFVIGGEAIYCGMLPYCDKAYVTMVDAEADADRFFPRIEDMADWTLAHASEWKEHEGIRFQFREYQRTAEYITI